MKCAWRKFVGGGLTLIVVLMHSNTVMAYLTLRQTDWSGGYGQQVWGNPTKFQENYHIDYATPGELKVPGNDTWYDPAWKYRKRIEIDNSEQGELDHFPVLVVLEHKVNIDYKKLQADTGNDIRFTDEDGKTIIPHDIERWDQGGKSYIWVKIPQIKDHQKDYFYMYYGNPQAGSGGDSQATFDNKYVGVWHLNETIDNGGKHTDATQEGNHGTLGDRNNSPGSAVAGQVGFGQQLAGVSGDDIGVTDDDSLDFGTSTEFTLSMWAKMEGTAKATQRFFSKGTFPNWVLSYNSASGFFMTITNSSGSQCVVRRSTQEIEDGVWHHLNVVVFRHATTCSVDDVLLYVDGAKIATSSPGGSVTTNINLDTINRLSFGTNAGGAGSPLKGVIDEVRISKAARSVAWIQADYKTQTNTYLSFGHEELFGSELLSSVFDAGTGKSWGYLSYTADELDKAKAKVKVRTGNNMYLTDAPDFETCDSITNKADISTNKCVVDGHRYIQYQVILDSTEVNKTPVFKEISISDYLPSTTKPVVKGVATLQLNKVPKAAPSPQQTSNDRGGFLQPVINFFEAIFK